MYTLQLATAHLRLSEVPHVAVEFVVKDKYRSDIPATVAIVRRRPDCDEGLVREHVLEPLLDQLVGTADELQACECGQDEVRVAHVRFLGHSVYCAQCAALNCKAT